MAPKVLIVLKAHSDSVADPEIFKGEGSGKLGYFGSEILSFTSIRW